MDAMSYVNIFETKGLEYLLVITFLASFVFFLRALCTPQQDTSSVDSAESSLPEHPCPAGVLCPFSAFQEDWLEENRERETPGAA